MSFGTYYIFADYNVTLGDCGNVIKKLKEHVPSYVKNENYYEVLKPKTVNAMTRAKKLCCYHKECSVDLMSRNSDPSTQVYTIIEEISKYTGCLEYK